MPEQAIDYDALAKQINSGKSPTGAIGDVMEPPKAASPSAPVQPDFVKGVNGYIQNPLKPGPLQPGAFTARSDTGKIYTIPNINPNLPMTTVSKVIEGNIRSRPENQQSLMDKFKQTPVLNPTGGTSGMTVGNVMEGFAPWTPSLRNVVRTVGAGIGGTAGAIGGLPTGPGAIATAGAGGALGAAGADALLNTAQAAANRFDSNPVGKFASDVLGKPPDTAAAQLQSNAGGAIQGGIQEASGPLFKAGVTKLSRIMANRQVGQILAPATNAAKIDVRAAADALSSELPVSISDTSLLNKLTDQTNTLGAAVDQAYSQAKAAGVNVPAAPVIKALTDAKNSYMVRGNPIAGTEGTIAKLNSLIDQISGNPNMDVEEYRQIKGVWDELINWSRNSQARTPEMEKAFTTGANAIRDALHTASPALEAADSHFSLLKTAKDAMQYKVDQAYGKTLGSALVSKGNVAATAIGGGIGAAVGGTSGAAIGAGAGDALNMLMGTTAYRTASLSLKKQVENAIASGARQRAIGLILSQGAMSADEGVRKLMVPAGVPRNVKK